MPVDSQVQPSQDLPKAVRVDDAAPHVDLPARLLGFGGRFQNGDQSVPRQEVLKDTRAPPSIRHGRRDLRLQPRNVLKI